MNLTDPFRQRPRQLSTLPRVVRIYIAACFTGFSLAAAFTALVIGMNVANIGHLVTSVDGGWLAAFVFLVFNGIVFSGVQTGIVIMTIEYPTAGRSGGHAAHDALRQPAPIPVRSRER